MTALDETAAPTTGIPGRWPGRDPACRPDGRWHRLLRALATGPMAISDLLEQTDPGKHPRWRERRKVVDALKDLRALGLVSRDDVWGWVSTAAGTAALARMDQDGAA